MESNFDEDQRSKDLEREFLDFLDDQVSKRFSPLFYNMNNRLDHSKKRIFT